MGILNVTPDSFSDGGIYYNQQAAIEHAMSMILAGASIIDVGGQSTFPGAPLVSAQTEIERVVPVIKALATHNIKLSIDTSKVEVMQAAIEAGASMINDVSALACNDAMLFTAQARLPVCLMHQLPCQSGDIITELLRFFDNKIAQCVAAGINTDNLILDPGFGFNKTVEQNLSLIKRLPELNQFDLPLLIGVSRKGTISKVSGCDKSERLWGSLGLNSIAAYNGASIVRVHDVRETALALSLINELKNY